MPRQARVDYPGALHHLMVRGISRQNIFLDEEDYLFFEKRLGKVLIESETPCFAWAFMPNHVHLLLLSNKKPISKIMQSLLTGYALYFNRKHDRVGYVFQNRFKSILCDKEDYFNRLIAYIHLNPIRSFIVKSLDDLAHYPWTGHSAIMGNKTCEWLNISETLAGFSGSSHGSVDRYWEYLLSYLSIKEDLSGGGLLRSNLALWSQAANTKQDSIFSDERILGDSIFVQNVLESLNEKQCKSSYYLQKGYDLDYLTEKVLSISKTSLDELMARKKNRDVAWARALICKWGVVELELSSTQLSQYLNISRQAVMQAVERGRKICNEHYLSLEELN